MKTIKFKFKNFIFIAFIAFVFGVSYNFVFADTTCECKVSSTTPPLALSNCITGNIVVSSTCSVGSAAGGPAPKGDCVCKSRDNTGGLVPCVNDCTAEDLFGNANDYVTKPPIWTTLIRTALGISGIFILLMFVYGGIRIMVSAGDKAKIKVATDIMKSSVVGLLIVIFAYTFVKFVVMALVQDKWRIFFGG